LNQAGMDQPDFFFRKGIQMEGRNLKEILHKKHMQIIEKM
jgi:hypothetical protein